MTLSPKRPSNDLGHLGNACRLTGRTEDARSAAQRLLAAYGQRNNAGSDAKQSFTKRSRSGIVPSLRGREPLESDAELATPRQHRNALLRLRPP
jgi:hypothetical protein